MTQLSAALADGLSTVGLDPDDVGSVIQRALAEDLAFGPDLTTESTVPAGSRLHASVVARRAGVIAGVPVACAVLEIVGGPELVVDVQLEDTSRVAPADVVLTIEGPARSLLTAERTMLNFVTHLSGIATATAEWVDAVAGTGAVVRDTRKTTPGLRMLEKYAVRCGGGVNHRLGLGDAVLIKDNHVAAAGGVVAAVAAVRARAPQLEIEVECDNLAQVREAIDADVSLLLLDNMSLDEIVQAVVLAQVSGRVRLEVSGGLTLDRARVMAETGIDYLAVGALTHSANALDLGLDVQSNVLNSVTP